MEAVAPYKIAELGVVGDKRFKPPFRIWLLLVGEGLSQLHVCKALCGECLYLQNPIINPKAFDLFAPARLSYRR